MQMTRFALCAVVLLTGCLAGCVKAVQVSRNIQPGEVIQPEDISKYRWEGGSIPPEDYAVDVSKVVGHKALKALHPGSPVHMSDVSQ